MTDHDLDVTATILEPSLDDCHDLRLRVELTSRASAPIQLNTLQFPYAAVVLRVETEAGAFVGGGPPPLPPPDQGPRSRVVLAPGETYLRIYHGSDYFVNKVPPGRYRVKFRYRYTDAGAGDWSGELASDWLAFAVVTPDARGT